MQLIEPGPVEFPDCNFGVSVMLKLDESEAADFDLNLKQTAITPKKYK